MNDPHWIEHMHMKKGAFGKKAAAQGKTVKQLAAHPGSNGKTRKQASLARTLMGFK